MAYSEFINKNNMRENAVSKINSKLDFVDLSEWIWTEMAQMEKVFLARSCEVNPSNPRKGERR